MKNGDAKSARDDLTAKMDSDLCTPGVFVLSLGPLFHFSESKSRVGISDAVTISSWGQTKLP